MFWVSLGGAFEFILFGREDLGPSVGQQVLVGLKLLLLFLQAFCCGYKPALEALLLDGILRHDKFFVAEAHLVFGEGHVIVILRFSVCCLFLRASLPILSLETWPEGIVFVFGTIHNVIISCAGIAAFAMAGLRAAPMTPVLRLLLEGIILRCLIAIAFFGGVHHVYII